jgi:murein DD-endopeptidase MepM/ murein hydrolase activator NlpD
MRKLWRGACVAALLCGPLAACASPHYPIDDRQAAGPAPLTMGKPHYPISEDAAAVARPRPPAPPPAAADEAPSPAPLAAPVAPVQTQSLPPPGPSAQADGRPRLQYASMTTEGAPEPASTTAASAAPVAGSRPAVPSSSVSPNPTPTAADTTVPPPAAEPALTPQMVVHDQSGPAPAASAPAAPRIHQAYATTPAGETRPNPPGLAISGDVVAGPGNVYENYEVQRGDHIDALARSFSTTRDTLIDINRIRSPFVIHPGQIIKVPVARAYVARAGDTLSGVARRFSVGIDELAQLNHLTDRGQLQAGQQIGLPSSMRDIGPLHVDTQYVDTALSRSPRGGYTPTSPGRTYAQLPPSQPGLQPLRPQTGYGYSASPPPGSTVQAERQMSDSEISTAAKGKFVWPVRGDIMQKFGAQGLGRRNDGVDIRAAQGTPVKAAAPGEVVYAGNQVPGFGNLVLIKHADGWVTAYAHLDSVDVQMKQQVTQGQSVGTVGNSGGAAEPELHFEVRYAPTPADKARPVDPVLVLPIG